MKKLFLISFIVLLPNCASIYKPDVWDDIKNTKIHTLRLYTGSHGEDLYISNFEKKAEAICTNGYDVLEKTRCPTTLHPNLHKDGYFNWVIRCK